MNSTYPSILAGCLSLLLLSACQREEAAEDVRYINSDLPITLRAGIHAPVETRGALSVFNNTPLQILYGKSPKNYTENWPATATSTAITFNPRRFYPFQNEMIYLRGFHPEPKELVPTADNVYTYDLSEGKHDLILSDEVQGAYLIPVGKNMVFKHLLSQIRFQVNNNESFPSFSKITKVILKGAHDTAQLNVETGHVTYSGGTAVTIYEDSVGFTPPMHVPEYIGDPKMFEPDVKITVQFYFSNGDSTKDTNLNFNTILGHTGNVPLAGNSYTVQFIVTAIGGIPIPTITPWVPVSNPKLDGIVW